MIVNYIYSCQKTCTYIRKNNNIVYNHYFIVIIVQWSLPCITTTIKTILKCQIFHILVGSWYHITRNVIMQCYKCKDSKATY